MLDILFTNDDGYESPGYYPLLKELSKTNNVFTACPDKQKSWVGKSITSSRPIKLERKKLNEFTVNTLTGTPADCVQIGIFNLLKRKPQLVVSGINEGTNINLGRILSSGTIGAGIEAYLQNVPAFCFSYSYPKTLKKPNFDTPALIANKIIEEYFGKFKFVSVNIPYNADVHTSRVVTRKIQRKTYEQLFFETEANYFLHKLPVDILENLERDSDADYLARRLVTVTPLEINF